MTTKATPLAVIAAFIAAAFCAFAPGAASAQPRGNVYAVSGVHVDETAANAAEAQQAGFAAAQRIGFERLVRRITLPGELAAQGGVPALDGATLERLVLSVDVQSERRSSTRYIGQLAVRFDPGSVQGLLRGRNLTIFDTRTAPTLAVPVAVVGTPPETATLWREVWAGGGFGDELAPLAVAPDSLQGAPAWDAAAPYAQAAAAVGALYATLRVQGSTASADLVQVGPSTRTELGQVVARINGSDSAALRAALASLAEQASDRVQTAWKNVGAAGAGQRGRISASALYSDQAQWERIKQGLEGAASTLISEIRIEAVGRQGALVSFSFVGERGQLASELQRRGVRLEDSPSGPVLRSTGR